MGRCLPSRHARSLSLAITSVNSVLTALIAVLSLTFAWVRGGLRLETYTHTQDEKTESIESVRSFLSELQTWSAVWTRLRPGDRARYSELTIRAQCPICQLDKLPICHPPLAASPVTDTTKEPTDSSRPGMELER